MLFALIYLGLSADPLFPVAPGLIDQAIEERMKFVAKETDRSERSDDGICAVATESQGLYSYTRPWVVGSM